MKRKKSKIAKIIDKDDPNLALQKQRMTLTAKCKRFQTKNKHGERIILLQTMRQPKSHCCWPTLQRSTVQFGTEYWEQKNDHNLNTGFLQVEKEK